MNWIDLKEDTPNQIKFLCDLGEEFSYLLNKFGKFINNVENSVYDEKSLDMHEKIMFSFERLRQAFYGTIKLKLKKVEKVQFVELKSLYPEQRIIIPGKDGDEIIKELPIKEYTARLENDFQKQNEYIQKWMTTSFSTSSFFRLMHGLRTFESYVFDVISMAKKEFYIKTKPIPLKKRMEIKSKVENSIEWCIENLDETAKWFIDIENELNDDEIEESFVLFTDSLSKISVSKKLNKIILNKIIRKKYLFAIFKRIKDKDIYTEREKEEDDEKMFFHKLDFNESHQSNFFSMEYLRTKIGIANNYPFHDFFIVLKSDIIDKVYSYPTKEDYEEFWKIFLSVALQRAGIMVVYEPPKGQVMMGA